MSNIIFLFSLPRSGSTWLQRLLASNRKISTTAETWLLLPLFEVLFKGRALAEYNQDVARRAIDDFFQRSGVDRSAFHADIAAAYHRLFAAAAGAEADYFLEKTPKNYLVAEEIIDHFPNAKFIFLWRDPADVALSLANSYAGRWNTMFRYEIDFAAGVPQLVRASRRLGERAVSVRYEEMKSDPGGNLDRIYSYLGIESGVREENDLGRERTSGLFGDKTHAGGEVKSLISRGERRSIMRLLAGIGDEDYRAIGYDRERSLAKVESAPVRFFEPRDMVQPAIAWAYRNQLASTMHRWRGAPTGYPKFGVE
jgi:hypothetical protein